MEGSAGGSWRGRPGSPGGASLAPRGRRCHGLLVYKINGIPTPMSHRCAGFAPQSGVLVVLGAGNSDLVGADRMVVLVVVLKTG